MVCDSFRQKEAFRNAGKSCFRVGKPVLLYLLAWAVILDSRSLAWATLLGKQKMLFRLMAAASSDRYPATDIVVTGEPNRFGH